MYFVTIPDKDRNDIQIFIELRFFHIIYLLHDKSCYCSIIIYFKAKVYIYLMIREKKTKNKYPRTIIYLFLQ